MSDTSQGPGWWQASDGKWYPPEQAQTAQAPASPAYGAAPQYGAPAMGAASGGYAEFGQRVVAYLIDAAIMFGAVIVVVILSLILGAIADALGVIVALFGYLAVFAYALYIYYLQGEVGGTPGKRLTGLKVIKEDTGQVLGGGMGIARGFLHGIVNSIVCGLPIGWIWPLFDEKKQTWSDKILGTVVIANQPKMSFGPEIFKK